MARGAPDYSNVLSGEDLHRLDDLAEIPPRFGQISSIDRAGEVVAVEDFRYGIGAIETTTAGLGGAVTASPDYSRFGGFTAKCVRVANANSYSGFNMFAPIIETGQVGLEIQFCGSGDNLEMKLYIARYTGTNRLLWGLRWSDGTDKVYIGGDTVGWTELASGYDIFQTPPHFHNMKFVVDVVNEDYERVLIDGKSITVTAVSAYKTANANSPHVVATIYNGVGYTDINTAYIDYVIITRNEP